jgi:DNA-binding transcriptional LysR family regulator
MNPPGTPTLDQLRILLTIVETGSFSAAARRLNRAQSVISYGIANLEAQLGMTLIERGGRTLRLTDSGRAVLADARRVNHAVEALRARVAGVTRGLEAELTLVVDVMFPTERLVTLLDDFARTFPTVALHLRVEALGGVVQLVLDKTCRLGISGWMATSFDELRRRPVGAVALFPVAAPSHPLTREPAPLPVEILHDHTQLVLSDRSRLTEGSHHGVISPRTWRLGDLGAKHALLLAGLGWGNMPEPTIREDVHAGRLVRLIIADWPPEMPYELHLIHRTDTPPGPAGRWLADEIARATEVSGPRLSPPPAAPTLDDKGQERTGELP